MFNLLYASLNNILITTLNSTEFKCFEKNVALVLSGDYLGSHRFLRQR